jgi:hypothetical protein
MKMEHELEVGIAAKAKGLAIICTNEAMTLR